MKNRFLIEVKSSSITIPQCCVSCLGPADGPPIKIRWNQLDQSQAKSVLYSGGEISIPRCRSCRELAEYKHPLDIPFKVGRVIAGILGWVLPIALLSLITTNQNLICILQPFCMALGYGIYEYSERLGPKIIPSALWEKRKIARDPIGWAKPYLLSICNREWAELFAQANNTTVKA